MEADMEEKWQVTQAEFLRSTMNATHWPEALLPAVAFAGRSNVGKSSLMNRLMNRKRLARTSSTPGCTQEVNFFLINEQYYFIDLPGYGYAKVPQATRSKWGPMMQEFFKKYPELRLVVMLLDIRRKPNEDDIQMVQWLQTNEHPYLFAVTKCDKVGRNERQKQLSAFCKAMNAPRDAVIPVSSLSGEGFEYLAEVIGEQLTGEEEGDDASEQDISC